LDTGAYIYDIINSPGYGAWEVNEGKNRKLRECGRRGAAVDFFGNLMEK